MIMHDYAQSPGVRAGIGTTGLYLIYQFKTWPACGPPFFSLPVLLFLFLKIKIFFYYLISLIVEMYLLNPFCKTYIEYPKKMYTHFA